MICSKCKGPTNFDNLYCEECINEDLLNTCDCCGEQYEYCFCPDNDGEIICSECGCENDKHLLLCPNNESIEARLLRDGYA